MKRISTMTSAGHLATRVTAVWLCLLTAPLPAHAQQTTAAQSSPGPMQIEPVHSGFAIVPEYKFTKVDHRDAGFVGAYGGWMLDRTFLIGGGGYWMAYHPGHYKMGYGGAVVEWMVGGDRPVAFSARSLFGGGWANLSDSFYGYGYPVVPEPRRGGAAPNSAYYYDPYYGWGQVFGIFEPQA